MHNNRTKETILILVLAIVAVASGVDLVSDLSHGADAEHMIKEAIIVCLSLLAIVWLLRDLHQQRIEIRSLRQ